MGGLSQNQIDALERDSDTRIDRAAKKENFKDVWQDVVQKELQTLYQQAFGKQLASDEWLHKESSKGLPLAMEKPETHLGANDYKFLVAHLNDKLNKTFGTSSRTYIEFVNNGDNVVGEGDTFMLRPSGRTMWIDGRELTLPLVPAKPEVRSVPKGNDDYDDGTDISGPKGMGLSRKSRTGKAARGNL